MGQIVNPGEMGDGRTAAGFLFQGPFCGSGEVEIMADNPSLNGVEMRGGAEETIM